MDAQKLLEFATYVTNVKLYPYFDVSHYVVMCLMVRDDTATSSASGNGFPSCPLFTQRTRVMAYPAICSITWTRVIHASAEVACMHILMESG